jgi:hypothetical protein
MQIDKFVVKMTLNDTDYHFDIVEHNVNDEVSYSITVSEPKEFHFFYEIENPITMKYNVDAGELRFESIQDLCDLEYMEGYLSNEIMKRHN